MTTPGGPKENPLASAQNSPRLSPIAEKSLAPFVRATAVTDVSIYWMPVSGYPMKASQRDWLLEFHRRLAKHLRSTSKLREECFLQFKSLYPDLLNRFTATNMEYVPMTGAGLVPGADPPAPPDFETIKRQVAAASEHGAPVDVSRWMPDHLHWFVVKKANQQRADFLGHGGMLTLYLPVDPNTTPPVIELPRVIKTLPGYKDTIQTEIEAAYSLGDAFLAQSKKIFGKPFLSDPSYQGLLFILPLFTSQTLVQAQPEQRAEWFSVFDGYFIESKIDVGMLLAFKNPQFDDQLLQILDEMKDANHVFRL